MKWDELSKTITFTYSIQSVTNPQQAKSGWWWQSGNNGVSFVAKVEYQNRTANSIQVRVIWVQSIKNAMFGFNQWFSSSIGGVSTGNVKIASTTTWPYNDGGPYYTASRTVYSGWVTVSVAATTTSVNVSTNWWTDNNSNSGSWSYTMTIPAY